VGGGGGDGLAADQADVLGDLLLEIWEGTEPLLRPDEPFELDFDGLAVEVFIEIEDMDFEAGFRLGLGLVESGAVSQVDDGWQRFALDDGFGGIDAEWGEDQTIDVEVGGGEAELTAQAVAELNDGGDGVGATEHLAGVGDLAGGDEFADPGGADGGILEADWVDGVGVEAEAGFLLFQEVDVTGALVTEGEALADADIGDLAQMMDQFVEEALGAEAAEGWGEGDDDGGMDTQALEEGESMFQGLDEATTEFGWRSKVMATAIPWA